MPVGSRLPPGFKMFDFFDDVTGTATSAKTLDTTLPTRVSDPQHVYTSVKGNIDDILNYDRSRDLSGVTVDPATISTRELQLAIPSQTNAAQWE